MTKINTQATGVQLAGYARLIEQFSLKVIPNWHISMVAQSGSLRSQSTGNTTMEIFPSSYWPGGALGDHLEFALKYDGTNLAVLAKIFEAMDVPEFTTYVRSKPTGKYARRLWFFYEWVSGKQLDIEDLTKGNYIELLEPKDYVVASSSKKISRQRVTDNLLGNETFCPVVRRTEQMEHSLKNDLQERCQEIIATYPQGQLKRALSYLYTRETKSSFEIEHISPDVNRTERFVSLLKLAETEDFCDKAKLIDLQNRTVDPRFADPDYRSSQNYVGESVAWQNERVHFVAPKPEDIHTLMGGLLAAHHKMQEGTLHPVVHAAVLAYGFVFLHPFEDGNGRIHRFLIHNILACRGFTPEGLMFPVSAAMLNNPNEYDTSLEAFSVDLLPLVEYTLDEEGEMVVHNETATWYRFIDMTPQTEALFDFVERTVETELVAELNFLASYDKTKAAIQEIVDMPDRKIDLFIRLCNQNHGTLSEKKRSAFDLLTDDELARMEQAVQDAYK